MSRFFVGQRVRYARSVIPENIGAEGRITALGYWEPGDPLPNGRASAGPADCYVEWDREIFNLDWVPVRRAPGRTDLLEPIQPDGARPSEFTTLHDLLSSLEGVRA